MIDTNKWEEWKDQIFSIRTELDFEALALELFHLHYALNPVYHRYVSLLYPLLEPHQVKHIDQIPFLPIRFFKTHSVLLSNCEILDYFASSGTMEGVSSKHYVSDFSLYQRSCIEGFTHAFGSPSSYTFLALLPNYLEQQHSSLVYMVKTLMSQSASPHHGFYLYNHKALKRALQKAEEEQRSICLIGVSYALLDLAEEGNLSFDLKRVKIMETGGMKGRRKEIIREELHQRLREAFGVETIYSEYGMCELFSQAYMQADGYFACPPWMKIKLRSSQNPLATTKEGECGGINVIDLANLYSCPFIETQDLGRLQKEGRFEVLGRFDGSDMRGCNLMVE